MFCQELAAQIQQQVKPALDQKQIALVCVGIGTPERAKEFCAHVGFPEENLYADPENGCYDALALYKGVQRTFFTADTPLSIAARLQKDGAQELVKATARWKPWIPPKLDQGLQQGGLFVFDGPQLKFSHYDPSTGAHANLDDVLNAALQ